MIDISNIKKIELHKKYKYAELCNILNVKKVGGNSKIYQMKELERHCDFIKEGYSFIFTKIYDEPKHEKISVGKSPNSRNNEIYYTDIETIMLYVLYNSSNYNVQCTIPDALKLTNMVNSNYKHVRNDIPLSSEVLEINSRFIYNFYDTTHRKLKDTFERSLRKMRSKSLIHYQEVIMICKLTLDETTYYNSLGEVIVNHSAKYNKEHRAATSLERRLIIQIENEVLKDLGHDDLQSVYIHGDWNRFKKLVENELKSRGNILYYYDVYDIVINHDGIKRVIEEDDMLNSKSILNSKLVENLNKSAKKKDDKYEKVIAFGTAKNNHKVEEQPDFYENSIKLIDLLISESCKINMEKDIKDYKVDRFKNASIKVEPIKNDEEIPF